MQIVSSTERTQLRIARREAKRAAQRAEHKTIWAARQAAKNWEACGGCKQSTCAIENCRQWSTSVAGHLMKQLIPPKYKLNATRVRWCSRYVTGCGSSRNGIFLDDYITMFPIAISKVNQSTAELLISEIHSGNHVAISYKMQNSNNRIIPQCLRCILRRNEYITGINIYNDDFDITPIENYLNYCIDAALRGQFKHVKIIDRTPYTVNEVNINAQ